MRVWSAEHGAKHGIACERHGAQDLGLQQYLRRRALQLAGLSRVAAGASGEAAQKVQAALAALSCPSGSPAQPAERALHLPGLHHRNGASVPGLSSAQEQTLAPGVNLQS